MARIRQTGRGDCEPVREETPSAPAVRKRKPASKLPVEARVRLLAPQRPVCDEVILGFDLPPSANRAWRGIEGGKGRVRSDDYLAWIDACCIVLSDARLGRVEGEYSCLIEARRPTGRGGSMRDVDNLIKPTLDLLHHTSITADDRKCMEVTARWVKKPAATGVVVVLRKWIEPEVDAWRAAYGS